MKPIGLITGAAGGVGFTMVKYLLERGWDLITIDNNFRKYFFGADGDVSDGFTFLRENTQFFDIDVRDSKIIEDRVFRDNKLSAIFHFASQPSHDWAAKNPLLDFDINAKATLDLLELTRKYCPDVPFVFTSTNKVYGDRPNRLPLKEETLRFEFDDEHFKNGINENMTIDYSTHSIFGVGKAAADLLVQEYGRYFGMNTVCFRAGCLTGSAHKGAELHGYLHYIIKCALTGKKYTIFGYKGKQVRDQLDFLDLCDAFYEFVKNPRRGEVYNIGGGYDNSISVFETIGYLSKRGYELRYTYDPRNRIGDHIVYYSSLNRFKIHYPNWKIRKSVYDIIDEIIESEKLNAAA